MLRSITAPGCHGGHLNIRQHISAENTYPRICCIQHILGFTHYCGKTKRGYFKVKRRTSRKKLGQSLRKFGDWAGKVRHKLRKGEMLRQARVRVNGHLNYYAITDNAEQCNRYVFHATKLLFKWLNRKSQRKAYTWSGYNHALNCVGWPNLRIRKDLNSCRRVEAC